MRRLQVVGLGLLLLLVIGGHAVFGCYICGDAACERCDRGTSAYELWMLDRQEERLRAIARAAEEAEARKAELKAGEAVAYTAPTWVWQGGPADAGAIFVACDLTSGAAAAAKFDHPTELRLARGSIPLDLKPGFMIAQVASSDGFDDTDVGIGVVKTLSFLAQTAVATAPRVPVPGQWYNAAAPKSSTLASGGGVAAGGAGDSGTKPSSNLHCDDDDLLVILQSRVGLGRTYQHKAWECDAGCSVSYWHRGHMASRSSNPDVAAVATHQVFNRVPMLDDVNTGSWKALETDSRTVAAARPGRVLVEINAAGYMSDEELSYSKLTRMYTKEDHSDALVRVPDVLIKVIIDPVARDWAVGHVINNPHLQYAAGRGPSLDTGDMPMRLMHMAVPALLRSPGWKDNERRGFAAMAAESSDGAAARHFTPDTTSASSGAGGTRGMDRDGASCKGGTRAVFDCVVEEIAQEAGARAHK